MHFYNFNIADFNNSTRHLTLVERALYRDLIDMYYHNESAIDASDMDKLARRLICKTDDDRKALEYVLDEFFKKRGNKYHHHRIDKELKNYRYKNGNGKGNAVTNDVTHDVTGVTQDVTNDVTPSNDRCNVTCNDETPMSNAERVRKYRQERKQLASELVSLGVSVEDDINMTDLRELHTLHVKDVTQGVTPSNDDCNASNAKNTAITSNQEPRTINQKPNLKETLNNNSARENSETFETIASWQHPELADITAMLKAECPIMLNMSSEVYSRHVDKFKNYYADKELAGVVIRTDARRTDKLVDWIKREWTYQQKHKSELQRAKAQSESAPVVIDSVQRTDWSQVGKQRNQYDSDLPASFHPSHRPVQPAPEAKADHVYFTPPQFGGKTYPLLPGMSQAETYAYTLEHKRSDETQEQAYLRIAEELEVA